MTIVHQIVPSKRKLNYITFYTGNVYGSVSNEHLVSHLKYGDIKKRLTFALSLTKLVICVNFEMVYFLLG